MSRTAPPRSERRTFEAPALVIGGLLGVIAVAIMLKAPRGLWGLLADRYDLQLFPLQRRVRLLDRS